MLMAACGSPPPAGRIAFVSSEDATRDLMLWQGGQVRRAAPGRIVQMAWSPEGERLAFTRVDPTLEAGRVSLYMLEVSTGHETLLRYDAGRRIDPVWSPDGGALLYVAQNGTDRDLVTQATTPPYAATALTTDGLVYSRATWSPDGRRVAFLSRQPNLYSAMETVRADGSDRRLLFSSPLYKRSPAWSPDGTRIALILGQSIVTADPAGGPPETLVATPMDTLATLIWAPDGQILYYSNVGGNQRTSIWAVSADGSASTLLARTDGGLAGISPGGRYLVTTGEMCLIDVSRLAAAPQCLGVEGHRSYQPTWGRGP
jgi:Tol biopolymer transport system component